MRNAGMQEAEGIWDIELGKEEGKEKNSTGEGSSRQQY